jgi:hypothetical protein
VLQLLDIGNVVPRSPIFVTLIMEVIHSSEMSVLTRATRYNIPEDGILHKPKTLWVQFGEELRLVLHEDNWSNAISLEYVGAWRCRECMGIHGLLQEELYFFSSPNYV